MTTAIERRWIELPYSLTAAAIMCVATLVGIIAFPVNALFFGEIPFYLVSVACLLYGFSIHFRSVGSRYNKYEALMGGMYGLCFSTTFNYLNAKSTSGKSSLLDAKEIQLTVSFVALLFAFFAIVQLMGSLCFPASSVKPGFLPSKEVVRIQKLGKAIGIPLIGISYFLFFPLFLVPYLNLRYLVGKRLENAPIIYLRCFSYSQGPSSLGTIVARVATYFGVLFAIVHPRQKGSDLLFQSRITEQALVSLVPDKDWQEFVMAKLSICSAVIIDRTMSTESLQWEIAKAIELVDPSRIAILQKKGTPSGPDPAHVWTLEYELGKNYEKQARKALRRWFENLFLGEKRVNVNPQ